MDALLPLLVGWPGWILSLMLAVAGLIWRKPWMTFVAAILIIPVSYYLTGNPGIGYAALSMPVCLVGAGFFVRAKRRVPAALLTLVPFAIAVVVAIKVMVWYG